MYVLELYLEHKIVSSMYIHEQNHIDFIPEKSNNTRQSVVLQIFSDNIHR